MNVNNSAVQDALAPVTGRRSPSAKGSMRAGAHGRRIYVHVISRVYEGASGQWERYDALDPDGPLLNDHILDEEGEYVGPYLWKVAERNGRQLPALRGFAGTGF